MRDKLGDSRVTLNEHSFSLLMMNEYPTPTSRLTLSHVTPSAFSVYLKEIQNQSTENSFINTRFDDMVL